MHLTYERSGDDGGDGAARYAARGILEIAGAVGAGHDARDGGKVDADEDEKGGELLAEYLDLGLALHARRHLALVRVARLVVLGDGRRTRDARYALLHLHAVLHAKVVTQVDELLAHRVVLADLVVDGELAAASVHACGCI